MDKKTMKLSAKVVTKSDKSDKSTKPAKVTKFTKPDTKKGK